MENIEVMVKLVTAKTDHKNVTSVKHFEHAW